MTRRAIKSGERGSILLMVLVFITMMSLLGALTLRAVTIEIDVVGAERQGEVAFYIAEAGIGWGRLQLIDATTGLINYATLFTTLPLISEPGGALDGWHEVGSENYAAGSFRVAIKDDAILDNPGPGNKTILMRSFGTGPGVGAKRLIEVTLAEE